MIRHMSREISLWGTQRIQSELALLGYVVAKATVDKYRVRTHQPQQNPGGRFWILT